MIGDRSRRYVWGVTGSPVQIFPETKYFVEILNGHNIMIK